MQARRVRLAMPKFELEADFELSDVLAEMGMPNAFDDEKAEFQRMNQRLPQGLRRSGRNWHRGSVATAVISAATSALPEAPLELTVDRPFVFLIRDREAGTVLFLGRVVEL